MDVREIFGVKPYLNPIVTTVTKQLGITIDLQNDPKDIDHNNQLDLVHSIDRDNVLERESYERYAYMDGCMPGAKPDQRITQTELMFYLDVIARYNQDSPMHDQYISIRQAIDVVKKLDGIIDPTADPDGLLEQTLIDNIPIIAVVLCKEQTGKTLEEFLYAKYPAEKQFIEKAVAIARRMPIGFYADKKDLEYEAIKQQLFTLIKDAFDYKTKAYFVHKLMYSPKMLSIQLRALDQRAYPYLVEQTATDVVRLDQYPADTIRTGECRNVSWLFLAFSDTFDIPAATVTELPKNVRDIAHEYVVVFQNVKELTSDQVTIDLNVFNAKANPARQVARSYFSGRYTMISDYSESMAAMLMTANLDTAENQAKWEGVTLDYGAIAPEFFIWPIGQNYLLYGNTLRSQTFAISAPTVRDYFIGAMQAYPQDQNLFRYARIQRIVPLEQINALESAH